MLDVTDYGRFHPGGNYFIDFNIGRDIGKFFYGGYSLDSKTKNYAHSNLARKIVSQLAVAVLVREAATEIYKIE